MRGRAYSIVSADELVGRGVATRALVFPAVPAPDPPPRHGDIRGPIRGGLTAAGPVLRTVFRDATVHGPDGAVTMGRYAVHETLMLNGPPVPGTWHDGNVWMTRREYPFAVLPRAEHLLCGAPGNYCHWLTEALSRGVAMPADVSPALVPGPGASFEGEGAALLPHAAGRLCLLAADEAVEVGRLGWSAGMTRMGGAFHPAILGLASAARDGAPALAPMDLYVSRRDLGNRVLRNEAEVEALCVSRGFRPVVLAGMPVRQQVALFAAARRVVGPHGAGLANILFCRPGAAVLELLMDRYANFCFRRMAACAGLRWGGVVGRTEPGGDPDWVHGSGWTLDLDRLAAALDDPAFSPEDA